MLFTSCQLFLKKLSQAHDFDHEFSESIEANTCRLSLKLKNHYFLTTFRIRILQGECMNISNEVGMYFTYTDKILNFTCSDKNLCKRLTRQTCEHFVTEVVKKFTCFDKNLTRQTHEQLVTKFVRILQANT